MKRGIEMPILRLLALASLCDATLREAPEQAMCPCEEKAQLGCKVSKVIVRQDHAGSNGMTLADVSAVYGGSVLTMNQREMVTLTRVASTSFECLDDRISEPSLSTPGGDLGEFILALASYLAARDPEGNTRPTQEAVDSLFAHYLESMPPNRPMVHCTDERAIAHLEAQLPIENLDLSSPPEHAREAGLLEKLTQVDNHGDSHIRLLLKQPEWYQLGDYLVPMVIKAFYSNLWRQNQDASSPLHREPKLKLRVLIGESNPQAFLEVSSSDLCHSAGDAPMIAPHTVSRSMLVSHLDAVSLRREELADFFAKIANTTPRKVDRKQLHQRLDRHGWLALETTGSRIAAGLPFYTMAYQ